MAVHRKNLQKEPRQVDWKSLVPLFSATVLLIIEILKRL